MSFSIINYKPKIKVVRHREPPIITELDDWSRIESARRDPSVLTVKINGEYIATCQIKEIVLIRKQLQIHRLPEPYRSKIRKRKQEFRSSVGRSPTQSEILRWIKALESGQSLYGSKIDDPLPHIPIYRLSQCKPSKNARKDSISPNTQTIVRS